MRTLGHGEILDGKYEVRGLLGEGAMGSVYEGHHRLLRKAVAIKVLRADMLPHEEIRRRFEVEARAAAALAHPNIVTVTDMGRAASGAVYFVMDRLEGESLGDRLARVGRFELDDLAPIVFGVLAGLEAAHAAGLVHRDLKPDNVFLARAPGGAEIPKILDFGIAKARPAGERSHPGTIAGTVMGTPEYMAPEQARGEPDVDAKADLYSLGVVLYQMVSGRQPFAGADPVAVIAALLTDTPPSLHELRPGLPRALVRLIEDMMARDRRRRPGGVGEIRERLAAALSSRPAPAPAPIMPPGDALALVGLDEVTGQAGEGARPAAPGRATAATPGTVYAPAEIARAGGAGRMHPAPDARFAPAADDAPLELARPAAPPADPAPPAVALRSWRALGIAGGALALALAAVAAWTAARRPAPDTGAATPRPVLDPNARVLVLFKVFPEDARLYLDDRPLASNPAQLPQDGATHRLRAERAGYATGAVDFVADMSRTVPLTLAPAR